MHKFVTVTLFFLVAYSFSCMDVQSTSNLLDSMPSGHDLYIVINPSVMGIEDILVMLNDAMASDDAWIMEAREVLGFSPLQWAEWLDALTLRPQDDIGIILDSQDDDIELLSLYLPAEDPERVDLFFTDLKNSMDEFDSNMRFIENGDYTIVTFFYDSEILEEDSVYILDSSIMNDPDFRSLSENSRLGSTAAEVYCNLRCIPDAEDFEAALFRCSIYENTLKLSFRVLFGEGIMAPWMSMFAHSPNSGDISIPPELTGISRLSFDMHGLREFLYSNSIDRDMGQGLEAFGFASFGEFLDCFSGDFYFGIQLDENNDAGFLQISIDNTEAISAMLSFIFANIDSFGDSGKTSFELGDNQCYRIGWDPSFGIEFIEFGIIENMLVISGDIRLEDIAEGISFQDYIQRNSQMVNEESGFILTADIESLILSDEVDDEFRENAEEAGLRRVSISAGFQSGILSASAVFELGEGNPLLNILNLALSGVAR